MVRDDGVAPGASGDSPQPSLVEVARQLAAGQASPAELHEAFVAATLYCEAGDEPGFVALGPPGEGLIPVFSSLQELLAARGPVRWFSTTGADLLGLVPEGYDIALDVAGEAPLRIHPGALRLAAVVEIDQGDGQRAHRS